MEETVASLKERRADIMETTDSFWLATRERGFRELLPDLEKVRELNHEQFYVPNQSGRTALPCQHCHPALRTCTP